MLPPKLNIPPPPLLPVFALVSVVLLVELATKLNIPPFPSVFAVVSATLFVVLPPPTPPAKLNIPLVFFTAVSILLVVTLDVLLDVLPPPNVKPEVAAFGLSSDLSLLPLNLKLVVVAFGLSSIAVLGALFPN